MNNWWEELTSEQIEFAKSNRAVGELLTDDEWDIIQAIPMSELLKYHESGIWGTASFHREHYRDDTTIYRLRPDWKRPEPEDDKGWVRYEVWRELDGEYYYKSDLIWLLSRGWQQKNFLGIEYAEQPGVIMTCPAIARHYNTEGRLVGLSTIWSPGNDVRPATPKYIYFAKGE